jgi:hypothetical protein
LTASYSGFVNGDTAADLTTRPTLSTTATVNSKPGSYVITASAAADPNYTIRYVAGALTITSASPPSDPDGLFVTSLYRNVLDRLPESAGFTYWTNRMHAKPGGLGCLAVL